MKIIRHLTSEIPSVEIESLTKDSFFASTGFLNLWRLRGGVPVWWTVWMDNCLAAVLPGVEFGSGPLRRFYAAPNGCYGRLCFAGKLESRTINDIANGLMRALAKKGYMKAFVTDFYGAFSEGHGFVSSAYETRLVDVSVPEWKPRHRKLRQAVNRAGMQGVTIERFDEARHLTGFMELVRLSEKRVGVKGKYSAAFYRNLAELSLRDERVHWIWCQHHDRPVASSIFLVEGDSLLHWQVYFDASLAHLRATKLIIFDTARKLARGGIRFLNMGASPPHAEGVLEFKRKWGGEPYRYQCYCRKSLIGKLI
jgi:hypothetical protein